MFWTSPSTKESSWLRPAVTKVHRLVVADKASVYQPAVAPPEQALAAVALLAD